MGKHVDLNKLIVGDNLYTTSKDTQYLFKRRSPDNIIEYAINDENKNIPFETIEMAIKDFSNGEEINSNRY